ncbi:MAG: carbohydrate binding family 9 domain-containing protein [Acidobacteria bacterium]|nr:carbohydrate binding family 9 domain-containing protein [Acidobacteriota bacterium]
MTLDGNLDEPAWQAGRISLGFVQKDPLEGEPSSERTEFRVLYTATTLYIGIVCYDSNPEGIVASERRRDSNFESDDSLSIVLDTFHDHRNAFLFRTNPLGTQYDAMITDEGKNINESWDETWDVASQIHAAGWTVEFAIPFKSLRVSEDEVQNWGLDLERVIRRKNEFSYWNSFHRDFQLENVSQGGHLEGLEEIETGLRLRVKPYLLGGFVNERRLNPTPGATDAFRSTTRNSSDVGLEVMKYRITPSLTADMTWNTDFAQTEVDDQQVNLDRFPLFFPEKREFFQEGAGVYEFGVAMGEGSFRPVLKLFHSRRIGLSRRRLPVPIVAGARITGRFQGFTMGLLNVQTEALPSEDIPASNYGVLRVKRDILSRSTIGGFLISHEQGGTSDYNRVFGADANFIFFQHLNVGGFVGKSSAPDSKGDNWVTAGVINWASDFLNVGTSWLVVDPDFRDDLGFVPRKNMRQFSPQIQFKPRPANNSLIRQFVIRTRSDYTMSQQNVLQTRINHYAVEVRFQDGAVLAFTPHTRLDRLEEPFRIRPDIVIPTGLYSWWNSGLRYRSNPAKHFSWFFNWVHHFGYYRGGALDSLSFNGRLRLSEQFSVEPKYNLNNATLPAGIYMNDDGIFPATDGKFTDHVVNTRLNYNFNNQWLTSTTIQYNSSDSFLGFNFRLNYIFRPGDDLFLVYNEGRQSVFDDEGFRIAGLTDGRRDRSLQVKLTYSFDY